MLDEIEKAPRAGGAFSEMSSAGCLDNSKPKPPDENRQAQIPRNPRAVREAKRLLKLEFLHECAGGIQIHTALVQTFAEIGDRAGVCYSLRRLFAHVKAAHPVLAGCCVFQRASIAANFAGFATKRPLTTRTRHDRASAVASTRRRPQGRAGPPRTAD
jgi:hypothetical protein